MSVSPNMAAESYATEISPQAARRSPRFANQTAALNICSIFAAFLKWCGQFDNGKRSMEEQRLVTTLVAAIVLAFVLGFIAQRLRLSPIVGYLLAGVVVGPHSPGFTADVQLALQLSEV